MNALNTIHKTMIIASLSAREYYSRDHIRQQCEASELEVLDTVLELYALIDTYPLNEFESKSLASLINRLPFEPSPGARRLYELSTGFQYPGDRVFIPEPLKRISLKSSDLRNW